MKSNLTTIAKNLRKRPTNAETLLWKHLRSKQLEGLKFRRQQAIGNYVADFVCFEKRILIELDGGQHKKDNDNRRDKWFEKQGFKVLRFWNNDVLMNTRGALETIREECLYHPPLTPPIKGGEI
ncbi:MAG TPA: DUF559 domain-containing protein [candidate division Zixibacteria bacterium]